MSATRILPALLSGIVLAALAGCSSKEPEAPSAAPGGASARPAPRIVPKGPKPPTNVARKREEPREQGNPQNRIPPGTKPSDVYLALPAENGNFTIVEDSDGTHPRDWYVAVSPAPGSHSGSFSIIPPDGGAGTGVRRITARLPTGFEAIEAAGAAENGWPRRIRCQVDDAIMALVPGGVFLFGRDGNRDHSLPAHSVQLDPYYIDVTEVSLSQFRKYMEESREDRRLVAPPINADAPGDFPALRVEWGEAVRYAAWAGKDLPTEAEWELAARGPDSFAYPWGNGRVLWDRHREPDQIDAVGSFRSDMSVFGVLDMAGNAREWVWDFFGDQPAEPAKVDQGVVLRNPSGPKRPLEANHRVIKGGSPHWELWYRTSASMSAPTSELGFRCVLRVTGNGNRLAVRHLEENRRAGTENDVPERPGGSTAPRNTGL